MAFSLETVHEDLRGGMPEEVRECWDCCRANEDFYALRNRLYLEQAARREAQSPQDWESQPKQYSRLTRRAIRCLTSKLYSPGPTREFEGLSGGVDLEAIYREARIDTLLQRADRKATLNGVCAIQIAATGTPELPIRLYLWGRDEFHAYFNDDDPMNPVAIVTKSIVAGQRKGTKRRQFEVWTNDAHEIWQGKDFDIRHEPAQGTTAQYRLTAEPNAYGVIPFAFIWNELPVDRFDVEGIGTALREANSEVDRMLTDLACLLGAYNRPKGFARNVGKLFRETERIGSFTRLPSAGDKDDVTGPPELFYLQPTVDVLSAWEHIHNFVDETFTDLDVPLEAAKGSARWQGGPDSGIALAIKNQPLKDYLDSRRTDYGLYERDLARRILSVMGAYYEQPGLVAASEAIEVELEWPEITFGPTGPDQDAHDQWSYQMGADSLTTIVMRQRGWSRQQATEHLEQVAEDRKWEESKLGELVNPQPEPGQDQQQQGQEDQPADDTESADA